MRLEPAPDRPWLSIVGIGEDGVAGLGERARRHIAEAEFVFGGKRHLALAADAHQGARRGNGRRLSTPPMRDAVALRGRRVCVLASGDPFLHGVGATLARLVPAAEMTVVPAPSAFSLAAARLGWPLAEIETVSLHGKPVELLRPLLHPGRRVLALTSDEDGPAAVAALLAESGFGGSTADRAGGAGRRPRAHPHQPAPTVLRLTRSDPLNVVAIEVEAAAGARILPLTPGLADELFEHDGQITKREIRALTLSALAPRRGELLWDIGAGSGSVAIEWMLADPSLRAIAIESDADRAARIRRNAAALGVPGLAVVEGAAPAALAGLPPPGCDLHRRRRQR